MSFNQFIQHKALAFKFDDSGRVMDMMLDSEEGAEIEAKLQLKNVCAKLPPVLVDRLENTTNTLNISKREFIQYALIDALDKADKIMHEDVDMLEFLIEEHEADKAEKPSDEAFEKDSAKESEK